jgi:transcriptional regulator with XRE-family HTH domain
MKNQPELGSKISALRNNKNMTQQELAEACHIDIRTIQRIETGEVFPRKHTLKLIANALNCDIRLFHNVKEHDDKFPFQSVRQALMGGIVFSVIYLPVIYIAITRSFSGYPHVFLVVIYLVSCIFFERGFYALGKYYGNPVLAITSLCAMILLPLLNVLDVLTDFGFFSGTTTTVYSLVCINGVASGIGCLIESNKGRVNYKMYRVAGIVAIAQSILFMINTNITLVLVPLCMSVLYNVLMLALLYVEYRGVGKSVLKKEELVMVR